MLKYLIATVIMLFSQVFAAEGKVIFLVGKIEIHSGKKSISPKNGMLIKEGDRIITGKASKIGLQFADGASFFLGPKTEFQVRKGITYYQAGGTSSMIFKSRSKTSQWEIKTPVTTAAVRGTGFTLENTKKKTRIVLFEGKVIVKDFIRESGLQTDPNELMQDFLNDVEINSGIALVWDGSDVKKEKIDLKKDPTAPLRDEHLNLEKEAKPLDSDQNWKKKAEEIRDKQ